MVLYTNEGVIRLNIKLIQVHNRGDKCDLSTVCIGMATRFAKFKF